MSRDAMNVDHHQLQATTAKAQTLRTLTELSGSSRCIPSDKDFHFYCNLDEFKRPIEEIARKSHSMLGKIGTSAHIWGMETAFPVDIDDAYEWLLDVNDEVLERVNESVEEFRRVKKEEEEEREWENEFGSACGKKHKKKKKKKEGASQLGLGSGKKEDLDPSHGHGSAVGVATKDKKMMGPKPKVSFHIATIRRPQDEYNIVVNNANQPFQHVWLQRSDDGQRFIHPLEKLSVLDFADKDLEALVPVKPPSIECTPFKLVEEVKGLKELAAKLCSVNEFAVDLEHNQYRSFQGLTCLMQISTRTEDFVVDTLKLRIHVGPYLREVFKDPTKKKVMHGADRDIVWLQRDFGIYVCNLFDTGQASRVLKLERYSLQYLLLHFCGVTANKEYQNADWRQRPLPDEMLRYGREDTHYLLYIYDLMRIKLFALSKESVSSDDPLVEVYKRSYDVCMQLYENELLTDNSYLHIYGLQGAGFNAQQLAIVSGLCEWRDIVARAEDESTGYVLPNKIILEIAKQMPVITSKLRQLVKSSLPYVERNLDIIVSIVRHSMQNAAAFEEAAIRLKEAHAASVVDVVPAKDGTEAPLPHTPKVRQAAQGSIGVENGTCVDISEKCPFSYDLKEPFQHQDKNEQVKIKSNCLVSELPTISLTTSEKIREDANISTPSTVKGNGANVQMLKKPTGAFGGALLGSVSDRKLDSGQKGKEEIKLEHIRSYVNLPSHSFLGNTEKSKLVVETPSEASETSNPENSVSGPVSTSIPVDIIMIDTDTDSADMVQNNLESSNEHKHPVENSFVSTSGKEYEEEPMPLSALSSSFKKCFQSNNQNNKIRQIETTKESSGSLQLKSFDYEVARKQVSFGEDRENASSQGDDGLVELRNSGSKKKSSTIKCGAQTSDLTK